MPVTQRDPCLQVGPARLIISKWYVPPDWPACPTRAMPGIPDQRQPVAAEACAACSSPLPCACVSCCASCLATLVLGSGAYNPLGDLAHPQPSKPAPCMVLPLSLLSRCSRQSLPVDIQGLQHCPHILSWEGCEAVQGDPWRSRSCYPLVCRRPASQPSETCIGWAATPGAHGTALTGAAHKRARPPAAARVQTCLQSRHWGSWPHPEVTAQPQTRDALGSSLADP